MTAARARAWVLWLLLFALATVAMRLVRSNIDQAHAVLAYLLIVLGGSVAGGRPLGISLAGMATLAINYFFQAPLDTLSVAKPPDGLVLLAFLATAVTTTHLLALARSEAEEARRRADEVTRLAYLGSETLNAGTAEAALGAIARVIRDELRVDTCLIRRLVDGRKEVVASAGAAPRARDVSRLEIPLTGHDVELGALELQHPTPIAVDEPQRRFLDALGYYAALGLERMQLAAEAAHADALREADRMKDILLASVSHDLRTPLTTIKAMAQDGALRGDENSAIIEEQADRLSRLVSDLLDLSRMKGGTLHLSPELNAAEDVIGAVARQFAGTTSGARLVTAVDLSQPALFGYFDFVHTLRILGNLVENALRYAPADTPVELGVTTAGEMLAFTVADRGPGVPAPEVERIFEPFHRSPGARNDGGAGLGLSIARRLAEEQGGDVRYAPRAGGGSVFTLLLPACDPQAEEIA